MSKFKSFLTAILLLCLASPAIPQTPVIISKVTDSIVQTKWIDDEDNGMFCTGFVVGITWVITAKHCIPPDGKYADITINGKPSKIIRSNEAFALLEIQPNEYPMLQLRKDSPKIGEPVTSFGFPYGFNTLMAFKRNVAGYCECNFAKGDHLVLDGRIGSGMSGGPVIDVNGRVVGLNQAGVDTISITCTVDEIEKFLKGK